MQRYLSIDFFRGLTIAFMIIVNTPGTGKFVYAPLRHAMWHGCTFTDLVFPSFMFIIGVSMWFSFGKFDRKWSAQAGWKILRRTALLFLIGLILNNFPVLWENWDTWRIMGVPQRLALGYGIASVLVLTLNRQVLMGVSVAFLLLYWGLLNWFSAPGTDPYQAAGSAVLQLDRWLFGNAHLYQELVAPGLRIHFDPEGVLSTLPAIVTVILGWLCGGLMASRSKQKDLLVRDLLLFGVVIGFTGLAWDLLFPINKKLWTSSYVLYVGGLSMIFFALSIWLIDIKGWRKGAGFFWAFGANSLFAYVLSEALIMTLNSISWGEGDTAINAKKWIYNGLFQSLATTELGSLLFAIAYTMVCWLICRWLFVRRIFIKI
ncbi:MAG: acyltransferase family protein [Saprospiraceae bacterium]